MYNTPKFVYIVSKHVKHNGHKQKKEIGKTEIIKELNIPVSVTDTTDKIISRHTEI